MASPTDLIQTTGRFDNESPPLEEYADSAFLDPIIHSISRFMVGVDGGRVRQFFLKALKREGIICNLRRSAKAHEVISGTIGYLLRKYSFMALLDPRDCVAYFDAYFEMNLVLEKVKSEHFLLMKYGDGRGIYIQALYDQCLQIVRDTFSTSALHPPNTGQSQVESRDLPTVPRDPESLSYLSDDAPARCLLNRTGITRYLHSTREEERPHFNLTRPRETFQGTSSAQLGPQSESHPSYGEFDRQAPSPDDINATARTLRYLYSSVVNNQNILQFFLNSPRVEELPKVNETLLSISAQAGLTMLTIWTSAGTNLSQHEKLQFFIAAAFNVMGVPTLLFSILVRDRNPRMARKLTAIGMTLAVFGFLAIMAMLLKDSIMLWVTGLACLACIPALKFVLFN